MNDIIEKPKLVQPTITITLRQLVASADALGEFANQKWPAKLSFRLSKTVKSAQAELKDYFETRDNLIKDLGEEIEGRNGKQIQVKKENKDSFKEQIEALLDEEIALQGRVISLDELPDNVEVSATVLADLDWLIIEGQEE
jgi:predicted house-cleaning noncanonical NTP pyrophosphatase (MazG superfamily)